MRLTKTHIPLVAGTMLLVSGAATWIALFHPLVTRADITSPSGGYPAPATCSTAVGTYCETWQATQVLGSVIGAGFNSGGTGTEQAVVTVPSTVSFGGRNIQVYRAFGYTPLDAGDTNGELITIANGKGGEPFAVIQWTVTGTVH